MSMRQKDRRHSLHTLRTFGTKPQPRFENTQDCRSAAGIYLANWLRLNMQQPDSQAFQCAYDIWCAPLFVA